MAEITVEDLLVWEPRLRPIGAAADGATAAGRRADDPGWREREVSWAVAARSRTPMLPPLRGAELVILPARPVREHGIPFPALLSDLATRRVAAVLADAELLPPAAEREEAPVPLLTLADAAVTADLEGELNRLLTERRGELYRRGTDLGRLLTGLTAAEADLLPLLRATAAEIGMPVAVLDAGGLPLAATDGAAIADVRGAVRRDRDVVRVSLGGGETIAIGPVAPDRRALARLLAERVGVAVEGVLARSARQRPRGAARAASLRELLGVRGALSPSEVAQRAALLALPSDGVYRVVLAAGSELGIGTRRWLSALGTVHDAAPFAGAAAAVIECRDAGQRPVPARIPDPGGNAWVAGSAPGRGLDVVPLLARQARFVAALLRRRRLAGPVARFDEPDELGPYALLYQLWGTPELDAYTAAVLGDLPRHDRRGDLRRTLLTFLEAGGSHVEAAARLGIHRNTLAYRLRQIAAATGRDAADPAQRLTLHLAAVAADLPADALDDAADAD